MKIGAVTLNEMRDCLGLDPYVNAAADRPMVLTATGYVPIEANAGGEGIVQKYNADEPRVPKGGRGGGQWTSEGSFGRQYASATPVLIDAQALTGISRVDDTTKSSPISSLMSSTKSDRRTLPHGSMAHWFIQGSPLPFGRQVSLALSS